MNRLLCLWTLGHGSRVMGQWSEGRTRVVPVVSEEVLAGMEIPGGGRKRETRTILLYVHRSEVAYWGRDRGGRGRKCEGSTADAAQKRPERPWTAARTMDMLRRCPLASAQRLVHRAVAVSTAVLGQSHKDNVRCTAVEQQLEAKEVQLSQPRQLHLPTRDLFWANLKVQLHLPPLDLLIF